MVKCVTSAAAVAAESDAAIGHYDSAVGGDLLYAGLSRAKGRQGSEERFEDFGIGLQEKMRAGFLSLAEEFSPRFRIVDGAQEIETVAADVLRHTQAVLGSRTEVADS